MDVRRRNANACGYVSIKGKEKSLPNLKTLNPGAFVVLETPKKCNKANLKKKTMRLEIISHGGGLIIAVFQ